MQPPGLVNLPELPRQGRLAAIDHGTVRLGIALSDPDQQLASPGENYTRRGPQADLQYLRALFEREGVVGLIVGAPVHLDGRESHQSYLARTFAAWLAEETGLPIALADERFTTQQAEEHLLAADLTRKQRKARRDKVAAYLLLAACLELRRLGSAGDLRGLEDFPRH